ncbi:DUF72 domain-containing protein [Gemmata sp. G18]|uniref:DUF72 domain-containing protein n=1 Tax=Gemmata palustris TaxID=2822762 RepID=A0ABS5BVJ6_9BACT|nr:DUF72 domain-containing protein [Gemmata palustris]MBP3957738.1 DUF72 domain-containing protein [Gemmata palustris]
MNVRIGTAGYAYPAWVGGFYPRGTTQHDMLPYYATRFAAVEINSSFYRPPTREQITKMARRSSPGFGYTLKVPKSVSHERSIDDIPAFKQAADHLAATGKSLGLIFQVPEAFHNTADNRAWITHVGAQLKPHRVAVEFRHRSWNAPNLREWMEHVDLDLVSVGVPDVPTLFPRGLRIANRRIYARLHSQNADNWYQDGKLRYAYDYTEAELREWAAGLKAAAEKGRADEALIFFNNCVGTRAISLEITADEYQRAGMPDAIANAKRLEKVLRDTPGLTVIDPPQPPNLFDE